MGAARPPPIRQDGKPDPDRAPGDAPTPETSERWRQAIDAIRGKKPLLAVHLAEGRLLWLRPGEVGIGYTPEKKFHRGQLDVREAEAQLSAWLADPIRLEVRDAAADAPSSVAEELRQKRDERARRLQSEAEASPAVQAVRDVLGGEIEEIRVLEEE